jgi:hypothetical protein
MVQTNSHENNIEACLVGAGNVPQNADDFTCSYDICSTTQTLEERNIPVRTAILGGIKRQSISLDVESRYISSAQGDGQEMLLCKPVTARV